MKKTFLVIIITIFQICLVSTSFGQYLPACFGSTLTASFGAQSRGLTIADFNSDGSADVATAGASSNSICVSLGNGNGTFGSVTRYASLGAYPISIVNCDLNNDGVLDLVTANLNSNNISVLTGTTGGMFNPAVTFSLSSQTWDVVSGDFNKDGKIDLATVNTGTLFTGVSVLLGTGTASFSSVAEYSVGASNPKGIVSVDFNNDGNLDLATGTGSLCVFYGSASGVFASVPNFYGSGLSTTELVATDFNGDNFKDVAVSNGPSNNVKVFLNDGVGSFSLTATIAVGTTPYSVNVGDFNGDGKKDVFTSNMGSNNLSMFYGDGTGGFITPANSYTGLSSSRYSESGDFNNDGKSDIIICSDGSTSLMVKLNNNPFVSISGPTAICVTNTVSLSVSGATSYTWNTSENTTSVSVSPTVNATFSVIGTTTANCNYVSVQTITVNALPVITASTTESLMCTGNTATLSALGGNTYTWSTNENTANIVITPTATTAYTVNGTDNNGCSNSFIISQDVDLCTGILSYGAVQESLFSVYPNPSKGILTVEVNTTSQLNINNIFGQTIIDQKIESGKYVLDIQNLANDLYFVKVIQQGKQQVIKLIKE